MTNENRGPFPNPQQQPAAVPNDSRLYRHLSASEDAYVHAVHLKANEFRGVLDNLPQGREVSIARTNLDQCEMWAIKAITK